MLDLVGNPEDWFSHNKAHVNLDMRNPAICVCKQKICQSACASMQSHQHLAFFCLNCLIPSAVKLISQLYFMAELANLYWAMVGYPEEWLSHVLSNIVNYIEFSNISLNYRTKCIQDIK